MIQLLFFGKLADLAGTRARNMDLQGNAHTISSVIGGLSDHKLAAALNARTTTYVLNEEIVGADTAVRAGDALAFLPPVSGG